MRGELLPASRASLGLRTHNRANGEDETERTEKTKPNERRRRNRANGEDERDKGPHPMAKPDNLFTNSWRNDQC